MIKENTYSIIVLLSIFIAPPDSDALPFDPNEVVDIPAGPTRLSLTIPTISESILNGPLIGYRCVYQGFLIQASLNGFSRRRRSSNSAIVAMTDVQTQNFPPDSQVLILNNILPNYNYEVNVSAFNPVGETPSVLIDPTPLPAIGKNFIYGNSTAKHFEYD